MLDVRFSLLHILDEAKKYFIQFTNILMLVWANSTAVLYSSCEKKERSTTTTTAA